MQLLVLACLVACAAAQLTMPGGNGAMMALLASQGSSAGGAASGRAGGMGGMLGSLMNNPMLLCRRTENLEMIPCARWKGICNIISMKTYGMPGLMKCSPMGFGCCIKDAMSLMMTNMIN